MGNGTTTTVQLHELATVNNSNMIDSHEFLFLLMVSRV